MIYMRSTLLRIWGGGQCGNEIGVEMYGTASSAEVKWAPLPGSLLGLGSLPGKNTVRETFPRQFRQSKARVG